MHLEINTNKGLKFLLCFIIYEDQKCSEGGNKHPGENSLTETQLDEESDDCESNEGEPLFSKRATMYYLEDDNSCQVCKQNKSVLVNSTLVNLSIGGNISSLDLHVNY